MSDAALRALEQAWRASGSDDDERAYLIALRRADRLDPAAVAVAAYLGDELALEFLDDALAASPPRSGVAKFLELLPGDDDVQFRAGVAAVRHLLQLGAHPLAAEGLACLEAAESAQSDPSAVALAVARQAAEVQEREFAEERGFPLGYPAMTYAYEVAPEDAIATASWVLARQAAGLEATFPSFALACCAAALTPRKRAPENALRAAVRAALIPWVFLRSPSPRDRDAGEEDDEPQAVGVQDALLGNQPLSVDEASAILAAAPNRKPTTTEARTVIEALLEARGYRASRTVWTNADKTHKIKLMKRALQVFVGGPGKWQRLAGTEGRQILLIDTAEHLRRSAAKASGS